jgi:Caspase domain
MSKRCNKRALIASPDARPLGVFELALARCRDRPDDVARVTSRVRRVLRARGFDVDLRAGPDATRAGILQGYDRLIELSGPGDVAAIYYIGHGGFKWLGNELRACQYIVPADMGTDPDAAWRGITAWELSIKLNQLTAKTTNVTVVIESCSASRMSFDLPEDGPRHDELPDPRTLPRQHLEELRRRYAEAFDSADVVRDPVAVLVASCGQAATSYDYNFTDVLLDVLQSVDERTTWETVMTIVRARVLDAHPTQRPDVAGPLRRQLFELVEREGRGLVPLRMVGGLYELPTGALAGDVVGDRYAVLPIDARNLDPERAVERITVTQVFPVRSLAERDGPARHTSLGVVLGVPISRCGERYPVALSLDAEENMEITCEVQRAPLLRIAQDGDTPLATLQLDGRRLTILDARGPAFPPVAYPAHLDETIRNVVSLAKGHELRKLAEAYGSSETLIQIELGVVVEGTRCVRGGAPPVLASGDRLYVAVTRVTDIERDLFVHVFQLDVRGVITILTAATPVGEILTAFATSVVVGRSRFGRLEGIELVWPEGVAAEERRDMAIAVLVTSFEVDVRNLAVPTFQTPERRSPGLALPSGSVDQSPAAQPHVFSVELLPCVLEPPR